MKKRLISCLCAALLIPALLTGCWQETPAEPEELLPQPGESEQEGTETHVILPEIFSLPYARVSLWIPSPVRTECSRSWPPCCMKACSA